MFVALVKAMYCEIVSCRFLLCIVCKQAIVEWNYAIKCPTEQNLGGLKSSLVHFNTTRYAKTHIVIRRTFWR